MIIAIICEQMGWTYEEYMNNPLWFTDLLIKKLEIDSKQQQAMQKKIARKGI